MEAKGNEEFEALATALGLEKGTISNLLKNQASRKIFLEVVKQSGLTKAEKKVGNLLFGVASKLPTIIEKHRGMLAELVGKAEINNSSHLDFIIDYLKENEKKGGELDLKDFNAKCCIGKKATPEQLAAILQEVFQANKEKLEKGCRKIEVFIAFKQKVPHAEGQIVKQLFEKAYVEKGYKEVQAPKPEKAEKKEEQAAPEEEKTAKDITDLVGRDMNSLLNSKRLLEEHEKQFGKLVYTRFPPEPNGYLHIGHAKAMRFNFTIAKRYGGHCYLRYDDTNPEKECQEYIDNIQENIHFMGYKPWKITHASDLFGKLYDYAVELIKKGKAFVCGETIEVMRKNRNDCVPSAFRDRPIEENLKLFDGMRMGLYAEGEYSLRAKIDYAHANPTLRDPVIYRIRYTAHPHSKNKWCIYPLYDYTHPICDSLEGITHSLCTLEFEIRRELYYWVLEQLDLYRPYVWEYSRLNISNTVLSKRKLHYLIHNNYVNGWDDPRILTINGMKRRGYTADAINNFCDVIGVTRRGNENIINMSVLENEVRKVLDVTAPRTMAIIDPVLLEITGLDKTETIEVPNFPKDEAKGKHPILVSSKVFVDRSDVRDEDSPNFYGIAPGKRVGLKYTHIIRVTDIVKEGSKIVKVVAAIDADVSHQQMQQKAKPKAFLHWLSVEEAMPCQVNLYGPLFTCHNPNEFEDFLEKLNPNSLVVCKDAQMSKALLPGLSNLSRFQFERKGFFAVDKDSKLEEGRVIWNMTVGLLQDKDKDK